MSLKPEVGQESYDQVINNTTHFLILYNQLLLGQEDHHCLLMVQFIKTKGFRIKECSSITSRCWDTADVGVMTGVIFWASIKNKNEIIERII